jgi:hypothetical protein
MAALAGLMLWSAAPAAAEVPVLGSPDYVPSGEGFGTVAPELIFNGGVPSGRVVSIRWSRWGAQRTFGRGTAAIYRPGGGYYPPVTARLRVSDLGRCPGRTESAYRRLELRVPQWPGGPLGPWFKWSGSRDMCDYSRRDATGPKRTPGFCKSLGEYGDVHTVQSIQVYRMSCSAARRASSRVRSVSRQAGMRMYRCVTRGCQVKAGRTRCRLGRMRPDEALGELFGGVPVLRVACRRARKTMTAFLVISVEYTYLD